VFVSQDFNPGYLQVISGTFALSCVLLNTADDDPEEPPPPPPAHSSGKSVSSLNCHLFVRFNTFCKFSVSTNASFFFDKTDCLKPLSPFQRCVQGKICLY